MKLKGPIYTVVPWTNSEQLNKVYSCLYSDSLSQKRWAVDQISVWNTRCHPSLPTAIESTVGLVRATIHDMLYQADKTFCQEEDIQMLYSMALIRFINLTMEHYQKAASKIRMSSLAEKLNIPSWLVDLRNEAVHSYCPSVSMLRIGADSALQYLEKTFWSKVIANAKPKSNLPTEREAEIVNLINQYKNLRSKKIEKPKLKPSLPVTLKRIFSHDGEEFISVLVLPGNFIAAEDIKKLIPDTSPFIAEDTNMNLPEKIKRFWAPLVGKINEKDLMHMFLEKLLLAQEKCNIKICQKTAIAWVLQLLEGVKSETAVLSKYLQRKALLINAPSLIYACMKGATPYSIELLNTILAKYQNKEKFNYLFTTLALYQGYFIPKEDSSSKRKRDPDEEIVFAVQDVEEELNELRAKKMRTQKDLNMWSSPSATIDLSDIPIGGILTPVNPDAGEDKQSLDDSLKEPIKIEPSIDDNFIIVNKNDGEGTVEEEITHHINTFPTARPESFDMVYRRRPKQ